MSQIEELQTRITAALERIQSGLEALAAHEAAKAEEAAAKAEEEAAKAEQDAEKAAAESATLAALRQELEDEKLVTAQMEERIRVLHARLEDKDAALAAAQGAGHADGETLARLDADLQALRTANEQLRASNAALREAHATGLADADAINASMQAELDGLRAARDAERGEVAAVLAEIDSAVAGATEQTREA